MSEDKPHLKIPKTELGAGYQARLVDGQSYVEIQTLLGNTLLLSVESYLRRFSGWTRASNIKVNHRIALTKTKGVFGVLSSPEVEFEYGVFDSRWFDLDEASVSSLLRRIWEHGGVAWLPGVSRFDIKIVSVSREFCLGVMDLLRRFGILSRLVGKEGVFRVEVVTNKSAALFSEKILGGRLVITDRPSSVLDRLPRGIHEVIAGAMGRNNYTKKRGAAGSLQAHSGTRVRSCHSPGYGKVEKLQRVLNDPVLGKILSEDVVWDLVVGIEEASPGVPAGCTLG